MKSEQHAASEIPTLLRYDLESKHLQRGPEWKIRETGDPESSSSTPSQVRLRAVADFKADGRPRVEYLTWIRTPKTHVLVFGDVPASNLGFRSEYYRILNEALVVP
jgi:hypothetical protein